jgi:hypothetical protein
MTGFGGWHWAAPDNDISEMGRVGTLSGGSVMAACDGWQSAAADGGVGEDEEGTTES